MNDYKNRVKKIWDLKLKNILLITPYLDNVVSYSLENNHDFNLKKANDSNYPKIRVNGIILIDVQTDLSLMVSSIKTFPLMGERHTVETFLTKLHNNI